jgi:hypothetical protein
MTDTPTTELTGKQREVEHGELEDEAERETRGQGA